MENRRDPGAHRYSACCGAPLRVWPVSGAGNGAGPEITESQPGLNFCNLLKKNEKGVVGLGFVARTSGRASCPEGISTCTEGPKQAKKTPAEICKRDPFVLKRVHYAEH